MEVLPASLTELSKDLGTNTDILMEAKLMDLENQVNKINGALNTLYLEYQPKGGKGWPDEEFDLPYIVPMRDGEKIVNVNDVKKIIEKLAKNNTDKFKERFKERGQMKSSTTAATDKLQKLGGKKKTYKKRHTKKKRRHTKRRSTKRKHYKKTRKH
tara:strand:- start:1894 stop:2361 length:468 start_codon:yes stop_codon:yes gene_type:complete